MTFVLIKLLIFLQMSRALLLYHFLHSSRILSPSSTSSPRTSWIFSNFFFGMHCVHNSQQFFFAILLNKECQGPYRICILPQGVKAFFAIIKFAAFVAAVQAFFFAAGGVRADSIRRAFCKGTGIVNCPARPALGCQKAMSAGKSAISNLIHTFFCLLTQLVFNAPYSLNMHNPVAG